MPVAAQYMQQNTAGINLDLGGDDGMGSLWGPVQSGAPYAELYVDAAPDPLWGNQPQMGGATVQLETYTEVPHPANAAFYSPRQLQQRDDQLLSGASADPDSYQNQQQQQQHGQASPNKTGPDR
jgi:hypothetical protein